MDCNSMWQVYSTFVYQVLSMIHAMLLYHWYIITPMYIFLYRLSQFSLSASLSHLMSCATFLSLYNGFSLLPVHMFGCNMFGIQVTKYCENDAVLLLFLYKTDYWQYCEKPEIVIIEVFFVISTKCERNI